MQRNLDQALVNLDGSPLKFHDDSKKEVTIKDIVINSLLDSNQDPKEPQVGETAYKRYCLSLEVYKGGVQDFKTEDLELFKKLVCRLNYGPLIIGQLYKWCDTDFINVSATPKT